MSKNSKRRRDAKRRRDLTRQRARNSARTTTAFVERTGTATPPSMRFPYPTTPNYVAGIAALNAERDAEAAALLCAEPKDSPAYSMAVGDSAFALLALGRSDEAEAQAAEALRLFHERGCPHTPSLIRFRRVAGESLRQQRRYYEAVQVFALAEQHARELAGSDPRTADECEWERAAVLNALGGALAGMRQHERAIEVFRTARDVFRRHGDAAGEIKALINQGHSARLSGDRRSADFAYRDAASLAQESNQPDLRVRASASLAELGPEAAPDAEAYHSLEASVQQHTNAGRYQDAFIAAGNWLAEAVERGQEQQGETALVHALALEVHPQHEHDKARLRTWAARSRRGGAHDRDRLRFLIEGARFWYASARGPLGPEDFALTATAMHDHFRMLSSELLERGRLPEALLAFEAGRALAHTVEVDSRFYERVIAFDHFSPDGEALVLDGLAAAQATLAAREVLISVALLPPAIVAFIVRCDSVTVLTEPFPTDSAALATDLSVVSTRLQERAGERAIPPPVLRLTRAIADAVGTDTIRALVPHSVLHGVPWRVVLRHVGIPWKQIRCGIEFGLLGRALGGHVPTLGRGCIALTHGGIPSASIDFAEEARQFAAAFQPAIVVESCTGADVRTALQSRSVVLLSCHGAVRLSQFTDGELEFALSDGAQRVSEIIPARVNAPLVILSACDSGVYGMAGADFPVGAAPQLLRSGAGACIGARFRLDARFSNSFFRALGPALTDRCVQDAVAAVSEQLELDGADCWRDLACLELLCR